MSFPPCPQLHSVSSLGLQLLALTGRQEARHEVHEVIVTRLSSSLLLSLASLKIESISELWAGGSITCRTEEEGRALVSLLESCKEWSVGLDDGSSVTLSHRQRTDPVLYCTVYHSWNIEIKLYRITFK